MGCPLRNPSLFTLKFDSLPQFYFLKQLKAFLKNVWTLQGVIYVKCVHKTFYEDRFLT